MILLHLMLVRLRKHGAGSAVIVFPLVEYRASLRNFKSAFDSTIQREAKKELLKRVCHWLRTVRLSDYGSLNRKVAFQIDHMGNK